MEPETLSERIDLVRRHVGRAAAITAGDAGASPVLVAVVEELARKADKAVSLLADPARSREAVVELEQAADSARVAARADTGAAEATREAIVVAHDAVCVLKGEQGS
jgi:hypothetical protein